MAITGRGNVGIGRGGDNMQIARRGNKTTLQDLCLIVWEEGWFPPFARCRRELLRPSPHPTPPLHPYLLPSSSAEKWHKNKEARGEGVLTPGCQFSDFSLISDILRIKETGIKLIKYGQNMDNISIVSKDRLDSGNRLDNPSMTVSNR